MPYRIIKKLFHVEDTREAIWRTSLLVVLIAVCLIVWITFQRSDDSQNEASQASVDAAAAREAAEAAAEVLEGQQIVVERSGCVTAIYGRYFLAIADVILASQEEFDHPAVSHAQEEMADSRQEISDLLEGRACPIPDLEAEVNGGTTTTVPVEG